jgi:hypothetical protein
MGLQDELLPAERLPLTQILNQARASQTEFLPTERLPLVQILNQTKQVGENVVLTAMLDTASEMIALVNQERQIIFCNAACAKAGGLTRKEEAFGMRIGELLCCTHAAETSGGCGTTDSCRYCGFAQAGRQGLANSGEWLLQCHIEDKNIPAEYRVNVKPLHGLGDGWQCYAFSDISSEKRREALEQTFFHDIMNRAGAVEGISIMLASQECSPEERADFMGMLSVSARALMEEIRSQSTLLAAEKGDLAVNPSDCNSLGMLQSAAAVCKAFGFADDKHVAILPGAQSVPFRTDATLLSRVLLNLLKNALEASSRGDVVTATCTATYPNRIRFTVHNEAVMPKHVRAHVFQRSFSTKGPGRGLGTYSIKLLTECFLGGRAWFDSADGQGTIFHVDLDIQPGCVQVLEDVRGV